MKANLIINLVTAHSSGNESQFESALSDLIHDEEKKEMPNWHCLLKMLIRQTNIFKVP